MISRDLQTDIDAIGFKCAEEARRPTVAERLTLTELGLDAPTIDRELSRLAVVFRERFRAGSQADREALQAEAMADEAEADKLAEKAQKAADAADQAARKAKATRQRHNETLAAVDRLRAKAPAWAKEEMAARQMAVADSLKAMANGLRSEIAETRLLASLDPHETDGAGDPKFANRIKAMGRRIGVEFVRSETDERKRHKELIDVSAWSEYLAQREAKLPEQEAELEELEVQMEAERQIIDDLANVYVE